MQSRSLLFDVAMQCGTVTDTTGKSQGTTMVLAMAPLSPLFPRPPAVHARGNQ